MSARDGRQRGRDHRRVHVLHEQRDGDDQRHDALREALAFDDVLLLPASSDLLPTQVDVRTHLTRSLRLNIPLLASAMDTVTEARMAIAMAQAGGLGVIHRNLTPQVQADQVRQVKKFESGMVANPITIFPDETLADAFALMKRHGISGVPVVERGTAEPASWSASSPTATCASPPTRASRCRS